MVEKIRLGGEWSVKKWVTVILFGAIIIVFALWGVRPAMNGDAAGGVAAVVNDHSISLAEFRARAEQAEHNAQARFNSLPEAQRHQLTSRLREQVLEQLILSEAIYQAAHRYGVIASDEEVKHEILEIPFLQQNGRFQNDRYRMFLQNMNLSAEDFERQIRKDIVTQKLQELFVGSAAPTREELARNRQLANQKLSLRFAEITPNDLKKLAGLTSTDVQGFIAKHGADIQSYYNDHKIDFTQAEKYHAHDLLIRIDEKRGEAEAAKLAADIHKEITVKNFAQMVKKYSEDPGSKAKGGDLGERTKDSMVPEFEDVALHLKPGMISTPVKIDGAFHIIYLESKAEGGTLPFEQVKDKVAGILLAQSKSTEVVNRIRETVQKGNKGAIDGLLNQAKVKWQDSGEFDLSSAVIPKLGDNKEIMPVILSKGRKVGLIPQLIPYRDNYLIVDVKSWHEQQDKNFEVEGMERMVAYRKAEGAIDDWARDVEGKASIQRNTQILQQ